MSINFLTTNSVSNWRIGYLSDATRYIQAANKKNIEQSIATPIIDRNLTREIPDIKPLYKAISAERADQLLNSGVTPEEASQIALNTYTETIQPPPPMANLPYGAYYNTSVIGQDTDDILEAYFYDTNSIEIEGKGGNDTIIFEGYNNTNVQVNMGAGDDTMTLNTTYNNTIDMIEGGEGVDEIILDGEMADYNVVINGDNTTTITNIVSGSQFTINNADVEFVRATDGILTTKNPSTITGTPGDDVLDLSTEANAVLTVNALAGNDTVTVTNSDNIMTVNLDDGDDYIEIFDAQKNTTTVVGGAGYDTISLNDHLSNYNIVDNGDGTFTINNTGSGSTTTFDATTEKIIFNDELDFPLEPDVIHNFTFTQSVNAEIVVNTNDGYDIVNLGGSGNDFIVNTTDHSKRINIDDATSVGTTYTINGSTDILDEDEVYASGTLSGYTITSTPTPLTGTLDALSLTNPNNTINTNSGVEWIGFSDGSGIYTDLEFNDYEVYGSANADTVTITPNEADFYAFLGDGDDTLVIEAGNMGYVYYEGGVGNDTVRVQGAGWTYDKVTSTFTNAVSGSVVEYDTLSVENLSGDITFNLTPLADTESFTNFVNSNLTINALAGNDTISLGGSGNTVILNLDDGADIANIDDSQLNVFTINGGSDADTANMTGAITNYTFVNNGNNTLTMTNTVSGTTTTIDNAVELVNFNGGGTLVFNGTTATLTDAVGAANTFDMTTYTGQNFVINAGDQNDTVNLGGSANTIVTNLTSGDNTVNVDDTLVNTFTITGGTGVDNVNMAGDLGDYNFVDNGDTTMTMTNRISGATTSINSAVENVTFADGGTLTYNGAIITLNDAAGLATTLDMTVNNNSNFTINTGDMNDVVNIAGTNNIFNVNTGTEDDTVNINGTTNQVNVTLSGGNNVVNVAAGNTNTIVINDSTASDIINLSGSMINWVYNAGTETYTNSLTNTTVKITGSQGVVQYTSIDGTPGNDVMNLSTLSNYTGSSDALAGDDLITLGGSNNNLTLYMNDGNDTANVIDTTANNFTIIGGLGTDVVNMNGTLANYNLVNNGDNTMTLTRISSGATTTIDTTVESLSFSDGRTLSFNGTSITLNDVAGQPTTFDMTGYTGQNFVINAGDQNDTVNLGGSANTIVTNLISGNNTVNVDDTLANTFTITGGTGVDNVNMAGDIGDYNFIDNGDTTMTMTNKISGATTRINSAVESVTFADGGTMTYNGAIISLNDAAGLATTFDMTANNNSNFTINTGDMNDIVNIAGSNNTFNVNVGSENDTVNIAGTANNVNVTLGAGDDSVYVASGNANVVRVTDSTATDVIKLQGASSDWTYNAGTETYTNTLTSTTVQVVGSLGQVQFDVINGTAANDNIDLTSQSNYTVTVNALAGDDTLSLGGTNNNITAEMGDNNDTVNINDANNNNFVIHGGAGTDTVNLSGTLANYSMTDNGNYYTFTNTVSGATIDVYDDVENINFSDANSSYDLGTDTLSIASTSASQNLTVDGNNMKINYSLGNGGNTVNITGTGNTIDVVGGAQIDNIILDGSGNTLSADLRNGADSITVYTTGVNQVTSVDAGPGVDILNLQGLMTDWTNVAGLYTYTPNGTTVNNNPTAMETVNYI